MVPPRPVRNGTLKWTLRVHARRYGDGSPTGTLVSTSVTARRVFLLLGGIALVVQCVGLYGPPGPAGPSGIPLDKVNHLLGFAVPVALFLLAGVDRRLVLGLAVLQAVVSELVQGLVLADRTGDPWDLLADAVGIAVGWAVAVGARAIRRPGRRGPGQPPAP